MIKAIDTGPREGYFLPRYRIEATDEDGSRMLESSLDMTLDLGFNVYQPDQVWADGSLDYPYLRRSFGYESTALANIIHPVWAALGECETFSGTYDLPTLDG